MARPTAVCFPVLAGSCASPVQLHLPKLYLLLVRSHLSCSDSRMLEMSGKKDERPERVETPVDIPLVAECGRERGTREPCCSLRSTCTRSAQPKRVQDQPPLSSTGSFSAMRSLTAVSGESANRAPSDLPSEIFFDAKSRNLRQKHSKSELLVCQESYRTTGSLLLYRY